MPLLRGLGTRETHSTANDNKNALPIQFAGIKNLRLENSHQTYCTLLFPLSSPAECNVLPPSTYLNSPASWATSGTTAGRARTIVKPHIPTRKQSRNHTRGLTFTYIIFCFQSRLCFSFHRTSSRHHAVCKLRRHYLYTKGQPGHKERYR